jgi:hypothetical protein
VRWIDWKEQIPELDLDLIWSAWHGMGSDRGQGHGHCHGSWLGSVNW